MKLSEISTDMFLNKICEITPYINEIIEDKEIKKILTNKVKEADGTGEELLEEGVSKGIENVTKFIPILLKTHRKAVYGILSAMNDKPIKEIKEQKITETMKQITELFKDNDLKELFTQLT